MKRVRSVGSVSELPQFAFGAAGLTWWGMWGLMLIEGITMVLVASAYVYLRQNYNQWPPAHTPLPSLGWPIVNLVVMLVSVVPAVYASRRAREHDAGGVFLGLTIQAVFGVAAMILRYVETYSLNVRWDTNAYGSVAWAILVTHAIVMVTDVMDTIGLTLLFGTVEPEEKHFVDATENSIFWYFVVGAWVVLWILVYLYPRWTT